MLLTDELPYVDSLLSLPRSSQILLSLQDTIILLKDQKPLAFGRQCLSSKASFRRNRRFPLNWNRRKYSTRIIAPASFYIPLTPPLTQKIQNRCNLHPCGDENYSSFHFAAVTDSTQKTACVKVPVSLPMLIREALLRNRKQRIEISFLCNQLIERACFNNGTVLQCDNAIVLF